MAQVGSPPSTAMLAPHRSSHGRTTRELPPEILADTARRLSIAAIAMAFLGAVALVVMTCVEGNGIRPERPGGRFLVFVGLLLSLAVYAVARRPRLSPRLLVNVGLGYEVSAAFLISMWEQFGPFPQGEYRELSFVGILIVFFPALIPATPLHTVLTALLAASTGPMAYTLALSYGYLPRPAADVALSFVYSVVCAGLAAAPSVVITRLVKTVAAARELGSYRLEERIGQGGMGEVWRASHRLLAQPAAVKLIRPDWLAQNQDASTTIERFRREARVTSQLRSQHTVSLHDFGLTEDGTFYYAMELLSGVDLETLVERHGPLPPARAVHLLRQACLSLEEAHRLGLVHRDVKPANLFVCRHGVEADHLKVLDFGLVADRTTPEAARLTAADTVFGTPSCMAPEQIRGAEVGPLTDVYALGCVAYWMLAGRHVFEGNTSAMTLVEHLSASPTPLRARRDAVPEDLERVVMLCLAKDPAGRPPGALALRTLLSSCACAGQWGEEDARLWWRDHSADRETVLTGEATLLF